MLYTETVEKDTLALIRTLISDEHLKNFHLVGGTAISSKKSKRRKQLTG